MHNLWKPANQKVVCSSGVRRKNTDVVPSELLSSARNQYVAAAEQAITALFHQVCLRTRSSLRSPRTLKELHQAGFNSLNGRICRDLLCKWVSIMKKNKRPRYVERPSWWPQAVRYVPARKLKSSESKKVLFYMFYGEYGPAPLRKFYNAWRSLDRMEERDRKTLKRSFCIRRVFKANRTLRGYPSAENSY
ncbi:uncharacterized protein N7506_000282 [Penicillium brevicompactum]|uniref:uncharacterized protein n=1 Tax=Penicillium brevicompactum TaxID=5074 RepID=UPI002540163F|nr:uncharacterized protein N7506_000282 [Penicillium brevicompactum]KAJ5347029.1 hypothetical protein N7506_000282 [Penicillium brevicompactum]